MSEERGLYLVDANAKVEGSKTKSARRRRPKGCDRLHLISRVEHEQFNTLVVINGLRGVCLALDRLVVDYGGDDEDLIADLAQAARVLSSIVAARVD